MKLGEALSQRADLENKVRDLKEKIGHNATVQEGAEPTLDPNELTRQAEETANELLTLVRRINRTNVQTKMDDGLSLADVLAARDHRKSLRTIYLAAIPGQMQPTMRMMRSELKLIPAIDAVGSQQKADKASQRYRELDAIIQETNWTTELV